MSDIKEQQQRIHREIEKLEEMGGSFGGKVKQLRDSTFARFPILFIVLSTFGGVATLYGFEKVIDDIPALADNPWAILVTGFVVLVVTGALYKKL